MLASGDYEKDLTRWHLLSMILLTASILVMCRLVGYSTATSLALLLPVVVWFTPFYSDLRVGNVNSFQIGLIGLVVWLQSRQSAAQSIIAAGFVTGLLVMFKPNLAPIAVLIAGGWAIRRQYTKLGLSVGGMVAGAFVAWLLSSVWLGSATIWLDWLGVIQQVVDGGPGKSGGNYAIITQFLGRPGPVGQLIAAVLLCALCLVLFWWGRRGASGIEANGKNPEFIENTCLIAMGCLVTMLASTIVWIHYYLLAIPMFIVLLRPWQEPGRIKTIPFLMLRVLPLIALTVLMKTALNTLLSDDGRSYWAAATTSCALILFVAGLWQLGYGIRSRPDPQADGGPAAH
jgi:4-amino-4-deoxy-L-arabinose transferase-like glycosyltransferase